MAEIKRGVALSTAGVTLSYCVETTAGTRPSGTSVNYTQIYDIKEIPDFNPEPETIEATDLEETESKFYVAGLKDAGGALAFLANFTQVLQTQWDSIMSSYKTATSNSKKMWFQISHPNLKKAVFFTGEPSSMGIPSMSVGSILETNLYITPTSAPTWETKVTVTKETITTA